MTYVRKGAGLRAQQHRPIQSRDLLWVSVNGYRILNVYRQPTTPEVIDYITNLTPVPNCLAGGDFNARHDTFEPGIADTYRGGELARWASSSGMDYIGEPGVATHNAGHVLDLTFSNIAFAKTEVEEDMQCGSDHQTLITTIPGRGQVPLEQYHYRIPETELPMLAGLIHNKMASLPDPWLIETPEQLDNYVTQLAAGFEEAIQTAGKPNRGEGTSAPWWTADCSGAHRAWIQAKREQDPDTQEDARKHFKTAVRKAKRAYWRHIIDNAKDDKDIYKVVAWHKLAPSLKAPPLIIQGRPVEDTMEKAEALRAAVLGRFSERDDLPEDPLESWSGPGHLPWSATVSLEEVERNTIGVTSTSPGTDRITVRLLKACWKHICLAVHGLFNRCLALCHFPRPWRLAEVAMLPKANKKDKSSVRSWRPIALLSCLAKGLERTVARRISWTALTHGVLSPQHGGALPKRSAMDLVAAFTHDTEAALAQGKEVTMVTMDVLGAFDALLKRRLLKRMTEQGWPLPLLRFIDTFLTNRMARVRLEKVTTPSYPVPCGTPQGSPLSPVLFLLYMAELLLQDTKLRFGYADDIALYRASHSLDQNVEQLADDIRGILDWGSANKVAFAPEKLEAIHITRRHDNAAPPIRVNNALTIDPITTAEKEGMQPALRWLGVYFDRKLTWRRHVSVRAAKARAVAQHIRNLARTVDGPPASSLRKAVITCVLPSLLYGTEAWYAGRTRPAQNLAQGPATVSARVGWHVDTVNKILTLAARGVLPVWRTTPTAALFRDGGLPSATAALEEAKLRFALRLQTVDNSHPLAGRISPPLITRGRTTGALQRPKTKVQRLGALLPPVPRPQLTLPHYTPGCRTDPTQGVDKETAARAFQAWAAALPSTHTLVFSDGSERQQDNNRRVGYGYAVYRNGQQLLSGFGAINPLSHVFDAEAVGAWKGLERTLAERPPGRIWLCIDSTSVIWGVRGNAPDTSQWAFLNCHAAMDRHDICLKWAPGHMGIEGNEAADTLANRGALCEPPTEGPESCPTISGIRTLFRKLRDDARAEWWAKASTALSRWYRQWDRHHVYEVKPLPELDLHRPVLHRWLALRSSHGDFHWYHRRFHHEDAKLTCSCGRNKSPEHLALCPKAQRSLRQWPRRPSSLSGKQEAIKYLQSLNAKEFAELLNITQFYSKICTR
jgi:ribonuclease HI